MNKDTPEFYLGHMGLNTDSTGRPGAVLIRTVRLIVTGRIGVKEIERLIQKLEIDKEILADDGVDDSMPDE